VLYDNCKGAAGMANGPPDFERALRDFGVRSGRHRPAGRA